MESLRNQLNQNTIQTIRQRQLHVEKSYQDLQDIVVNKLQNHSLNYGTMYRVITIGDLYVKNYLTCYYAESVVKNYTKLGYRFADGLKPSVSFPSIDELEYLTNRLEKYLTSQGLKVVYTSHCCIKISWD